MAVHQRPTGTSAPPRPGAAPSDAIDREGWPEIDGDLMQAARDAVPAFPLDLLPSHWRDWISDTARLAGTPTDYVAQALLSAVSGVCGAGVAARVGATWSEPLVLWQALVGGPSSGRSLALATGRSLLAPVEAELAASDDKRRQRHDARLALARRRFEQWQAECAQAAEDGGPAPPMPAGADFDEPYVAPRIAVGDASLASLAEAVSGHPAGVMLWRDGSPAWLAELGGARKGGNDRDQWLQAWAGGAVAISRRGASALHVERFPVGILCTLPAVGVTALLQGAGDDLAARFLYAWPDPAAHCPLDERRDAHDDFALAAMLRIAQAAGTPQQPLVLHFDQGARSRFDRFLTDLHARLREAEGLEAAWLGKGRSTVPRLAAALSLLAWSCESGPDDPAGHILGKDVDAAARLWSDYFRPHAMAALERHDPPEEDLRLRRVVRWLQKERATLVSLMDIRRSALGGSVKALAAEQVIHQLEEANVLFFADSKVWRGPGRPAQRWLVNPAVATLRATV